VIRDHIQGQWQQRQTNKKKETMDYDIIQHEDPDTGVIEYGVFHLDSGTIKEWCSTLTEAELLAIESEEN
jgi:hypothetical protein